MPSRRVSKNISHRQKMRNERSLIDSTIDDLTLSPRDKLLKELRNPKKREILEREMKKLGGSLQKVMNILVEPSEPVRSLLSLVAEARVDLSELQITHFPDQPL